MRVAGHPGGHIRDQTRTPQIVIHGRGRYRPSARGDGGERVVGCPARRAEHEISSQAQRWSAHERGRLRCAVRGISTTITSRSGGSRLGEPACCIRAFPHFDQPLSRPCTARNPATLVRDHPGKVHGTTHTRPAFPRIQRSAQPAQPDYGRRRSGRGSRGWHNRGSADGRRQRDPGWRWYRRSAPTEISATPGTPAPTQAATPPSSTIGFQDQAAEEPATEEAAASTPAASAEAVDPGTILEEVTIRQLRDHLDSGAFTIVDLVQATLARIEELDGGEIDINAVITVNPDAGQIAADLDAELQAGQSRGLDARHSGAAQGHHRHGGPDA